MTARSYFTGLYDDSADPWRLATTAYELAKFDATVAALPHDRHELGFEPGCSIGILTARLAPRCERLLAMDLDPRPLAELDLPGVDTRTGRIPEDWPEARFDLVVLSEILYFLGADDRATVGQQVLATLVPGGHLVAVHWRHAFEEADTTGDEAHAELASLVGLDLVSSRVEADYRLEVFARA